MKNYFYSMCRLGNRLLKIDDISECTKNTTGMLHKLFCTNETINYKCDPYYELHDLIPDNGIKGLTSGVFFGNYILMIIQFYGTYIKGKISFV